MTDAPSRLRLAALGRRLPWALAAGAAVWVGVALARAEPYAVPNRPLPPLQGSFLDGRPLDRDALAGRPWVVVLWVPG